MNKNKAAALLALGAMLSMSSAMALTCNSVVYANPTVTSTDTRVRSTLGITFTGTYGNASRTEFCTAELLDDTGGDSTPYVILADHCLPTATVAGDSLAATTYWDVDGAYGTNPPSTEQVTQFAPYRAYTVTVKAIYQDSALLELNAPPPQNARFSAWAAVLPAANSSVSNLNHSEIYQSQVVNATWTGQQAQGLPAPYSTAVQYLLNDTSGIGLPGSSGSGVYTSGGSLVAILNSGDQCSQNDATALATSFVGDGTQTGSFGYWLDAGNTGMTATVGRDAPYSSATPALNAASTSGGGTVAPATTGGGGGGAPGPLLLGALGLLALVRKRR